MRLGIALVVSMAFTVSVGGLMSSALPPYGLEAGQLWRHSALSAIAAEHLVRSSPDRIPPAAITAALLHDIGKLLVAQNADEEVFAFIRRAQEEGGLKLQDAEMEIMGVNHAEIGGIVAQHWALPDRIVRAIMYHHSPGQWDDPICDAVYVANVAATTIEAAGIEAAAPEAPSQEVMSRLDLHPFDFPKFCSQCAERFTRLRALYGA